MHHPQPGLASASANQIREPRSFGKRSEPHLVTISRNGRSRQFAINPIYFSLAACIVVMFSVGYLAATTYLVLRDDLMSAKTARNAQIIHEYEDRIAALRTNLDKVTSRQLLDQQAIEAKIETLLVRQQQLAGQDDSFSQILEKAGKLGLHTRADPIDQTVTGSISKEENAKPNSADQASMFSFRGTQANPNPDFASAQTTNSTTFVQSASILTRTKKSAFFDAVDHSLLAIDAKRKSTIEKIRSATESRSSKLAKLLKSAGARLPKQATSAIGGPFVPIDSTMDINTHVSALDAAIESFEKLKSAKSSVPVANPMPGNSISSKFGPRRDPFNKRMAMHSGIDFRGKRGTPIYSTADGLVTHAGWKGGYGKLVEIMHPNGLTTRYAHLSKVLVKAGQRIKAGKQIGKLGSTGRSTGPHLHYEVRRGKKALNPANYFNIGRKIDRLLQG